MNIALIGMPTSGKSTVGVVLAKMLGMSFVDTDIIIQQQYKKRLCEIIDEKGRDGFIKVESDVIKNLNIDNTIIATGGSAVYSSEAMDSLKHNGKIIYLSVSLKDLQDRFTDYRERGVLIEEGKTIKDLFLERQNLYEKYADIVVSEEGKSLKETVAEIVEIFK